MIKYPEQLPYPRRNGYGFEHIDTNARSSSAAGRPRVRRQFSSAPDIASVSWVMTPSESQLFRAWYQEVLVSGTAWFECPLLTDQGLQNYKARFAQVYDGPSLVGLCHWGYSAELELFEAPILKGGWALYAPDYLANSDLLDIAMNIKWPRA